MKMKFSIDFLLEADLDDLSFILANEYGGNDAVFWRSLEANTHPEGNYFHYLIMHGKHEHLTKFTPPKDFSAAIRSHLTMGKNFIHIASAHTKDSMNQEALQPFLENAISSDPALLVEKSQDGLHPLAIAITQNNALMVNTLLKMIIQYHSKLSLLQLIDLFIVDRNPSQELSLDEFARTVPGISEDIITALNNHSAQLFSRNIYQDQDHLVQFKSPESFEQAVTGESSSSVPALPGNSGYWLNIVRALQLHHNNSILALKKYAAFESALSGDQFIPPAKLDLEIISKLIYQNKIDIDAMKEKLTFYDRSNPLKTLSRNVLHLAEENEKSAAKVGLFIATSLALIDFAILFGYPFLINFLYQQADQERDHLKSTYPDCINRQTKEPTDDIRSYICQLIISTYPCNDESQPWYDQYVNDYNRCFHAFYDYRVVAYTSPAIFLLALFLMIPLWSAISSSYRGNNSEVLTFYPLAKLPFRLANKIFGEHNPETINYDKAHLVNELKSGFETFIPLFTGSEKEAIQKILGKLNSPLNEITTKEIFTLTSEYLKLLGHYSSHVNHLSLSSRVAVEKLQKLLKSPEAAPSLTQSTPVRTPLLNRYSINQSSSINLDIDAEKCQQNEETPLIRKTENKTRCTII